MARMSPSASIEERFAAGTGVVDANGCWPWQRATTGAGYGQLAVGGRRKEYAHRIAYTLHVGPIPEGREIHHKCRNRTCVNPAHLEAVTHAEHMDRDKRNERKTMCKRGHDLTLAENVYEYGGRRWCRPCTQKKNREWHRARSVA